MTKAEELKALEKFIMSMPHESYIRPALAELMPQIERDMASDIQPDLIGTRAEMQRQIGEAHASIATMQKEKTRLTEETRTLKNLSEHLQRTILEARQIARRIAEA
jgi:hypothetical protein